MIENIFIATIAIMVLLLAIIKIKYPFWNIQPVYHVYDFWRFLYTSPITIYHHQAIKTKYCDLENSLTMNYLDCSDDFMGEFLDLLICHYIPSERITHTLQRHHLDSIFKGHREPCFITIYFEPTFSSRSHYIDKNENLEIPRKPHRKPIACIASLPSYFYIRPTLKEPSFQKMTVYMMDFLTIHRERNHIEIGRKLFQSHEYNQRLGNPDVLITLFKREIELIPGVIPLLQYTTSTFYLRNIHFGQLPPHFTVSSIEKGGDISIIHDFFSIETSRVFTEIEPPFFDFILIPDIPIIKNMIDSGIYWVLSLQRGGDTFGIYFFRDEKMSYDDIEEMGGNTLSLVASIMNMNSKDENLFYLGFLYAIRSILKKNKTFQMLIIEEVGHNQILFGKWREKHSPVFTNKTAYYSFNWIFPGSPISARRTFIL
jgi:hypothetical protein